MNQTVGMELAALILVAGAAALALLAIALAALDRRSSRKGSPR